MAFVKATRRQINLRMAICGPTGSGKTYTAMRIASYLAKQCNSEIAVIDTEKGSARKYADKFSFDVDELKTFEPQKMIDGLKAAADGGYKVSIVDSLSHFWNDEGGLLDQVDKFAKKMKTPDSFAAWKEGTPIQRKFIAAILDFPGHIIVTMRSEMDYERVKGDDGRTQIKKLGLAPVQRKGMEYEFDLVLDIDSDHIGVVSKSRCDELADYVSKKPGDDFAAPLWAWLTKGEEKKEEHKQFIESSPSQAESKISNSIKRDMELEGFISEVESRDNLKDLGPLFGTLPGNRNRQAAANALCKRALSLAQDLTAVQKIEAWMKKQDMSFDQSVIDLKDQRLSALTNDEIESTFQA